MVEHSSKQHRIIIHDFALQAPMIEMIEEFSQPSNINRGVITVIPANLRNWAFWEAEHQFITLTFESNLLLRYIAEATDARNVELLPTLSRPDPLIHSIAIALKSELESNKLGGRLYVDSLVSALITHLLRNYSVQKCTLPSSTSGLPKRKLLEYAPSKNAALRFQYTTGNVLGGEFNVFGANAELSITPQESNFWSLRFW